MTGTEQITAERQRQIDKEGVSVLHDVRAYRMEELMWAAICYAEHGDNPQYLDGAIPPDWPWANEWWKPSPDHSKNLVKAGALIAADLDRRAHLEDHPHEQI